MFIIAAISGLESCEGPGGGIILHSVSSFPTDIIASRKLLSAIFMATLQIRSTLQFHQFRHLQLGYNMLVPQGQITLISPWFIITVLKITLYHDCFLSIELDEIQY